MTTTWDRDPVWFHGDVAAGNLLVRDGRLAAVLDFGSSGVGDPACDLVIAWTFLSGASRDAFRAELGVDAAHLVARPRLGAVEGADHAGRAPRARLARRGRSPGATSSRSSPTTHARLTTAADGRRHETNGASEVLDAPRDETSVARESAPENGQGSLASATSKEDLCAFQSAPTVLAVLAVCRSIAGCSHGQVGIRAATVTRLAIVGTWSAPT